MDVEAGDLLGERLGDDVAGRVGRRQHVGEAVEPARRHQERARREAGLDRAAYDLLALGEEQPVLGLEVLAQLDVAQVAVVGEPRVGGVGDLDELSHRPRSASGCATATTSPTTMIAGARTAFAVDLLGQGAEGGEHGALGGHRPVAHDRDRGVGAAAALDQRLGDRGGVLDGHHQQEGAAQPGDGLPVDERLGVAGRQVARDDGEVVGDAAVGDGDAGEGGYGDRAGEPRDHGHRYAGLAARQHLLVAAAEDEVVAALEPHHPLARERARRRSAR